MRRYLLVGAAVLWGVGCSTLPSPLTPTQLTMHAENMSVDVSRGQEPIEGRIGLYEAMARALKYNLDHRVAMMEADLAQRDFSLSKYDQLPQLVATGGYYSRNNDQGASSLSLLSDRESLEPSTSTQRDLFEGDLTASWNILDFGLSYVRSQQLGNEAMVIEERRRKAIIDIMEDVHRAYWRASSAQRLTSRLSELEDQLREAFENSRSLYKSRQTAPMPALSYQRELNAIMAEAQKMQRELSMAKMELAGLMNVSVSEAFVLDLPSHTAHPRRLVVTRDEMVREALNNRPEIRESAYLMRIGELEIKKATLEALPSLNVFAGVNTHSNDFLYNNDWSSLGAKASWNLMKLFETPERQARARGQAELERQKALATAMAIMTQVNVARARYNFLQNEYNTASKGTMVQFDIMQQVEAQNQTRAVSHQTLVREKMNTIMSEARRDSIHAEMQEAAARIYTAMGYDPYSADISGTESVANIAQSLKVLWTSRKANPGVVEVNLSHPSSAKSDILPTAVRYVAG